MLDFQSRLLQRASEICGGWGILCLRLGVSEHSVKFWLEGKAKLPEKVFLQAADIVLADDVARAEHDRRKHPRVAAIQRAPSAGPERTGA